MNIKTNFCKGPGVKQSNWQRGRAHMAGRLVVALMTQSCTLATPPSAAPISLKLSRATILRPPPSCAPPSISIRTITMNINSQEQQQDNLEGIFKQKQILRSKVRKALKAMDPALRSHEGNTPLFTLLEPKWLCYNSL